MLFLMLLVLPSTLTLVAQTIAPKKLGYPEICANKPNFEYPLGYNRYEVSFKVSGFDATTTYFVILSDDKGSFSNPIKPVIIPNNSPPNTPADTPTDKTLTFELPSNIIGSDIYQLKVQSSTGYISQPFKASDLQSSFPIYYLSYSGPFYINNQNGSVSFCNGGSVTLTIDNTTPSVPNSSPLQYPQLKYNWYKDGTIIPNETSSSLSVNQIGEYYVEINYGPCTDVNTHSQSVKVTGASGSVANINSSLGNPFCSTTNMTTLTASTGNSYVWKKDGAVLPGEIAQTYQTNLPGIYTCDVDFGGCKSTGTIDLKADQIASTISVDVDKINYIQDGEALAVTTTTTAVNPSYQWFLNDVPISGETQSFLDITAQGKYKVTITQTSGCQIVNEFPFEVSYKVDYNVSKIPNIISPNNDGTNDTWIIPDEYTNGKANVLILSSVGENVFQTENYDNYSGWPQAPIDFKNFNPVYYYIITPSAGSAKKGSITLVK